MPKWSLRTRILQTHVSSCVFWVLCLITVIKFFSSYGVYNYEHLPLEVVETQLYIQTVPNLPLKKGTPECTYETLKSTKSVEPGHIPKKFDDFSANGIVNGSYMPEKCNPTFSVAILVTYRNRQNQLDIFLPYMHNFLRKQNIHYKIYLIEQQDEKLWNKGILYNIGAKQAKADNFPCLILHDVDLLPLNEANFYVCTNEPRHMSASIDKFRYVLPYPDLVGGVLSIKTEQFFMLNGFSNRFEAWGGEDDDFAFRINSHKLNIIRFPREMSSYTMMPHPPEPLNALRTNIMAENQHRTKSDGIDSLPYIGYKLVNNRLFTLIGVKL